MKFGWFLVFLSLVLFVINNKMPRGKALCNEIRQLIIDHKASGYSLNKIAQMLGLSKSTVQSIISHHNKTNNVEPCVLKGSKPIVTERDCRALVSIVKKNRQKRSECCGTKLLAKIYRWRPLSDIFIEVVTVFIR